MLCIRALCHKGKEGQLSVCLGEDDTYYVPLAHLQRTALEAIVKVLAHLHLELLVRVQLLLGRLGHALGLALDALLLLLLLPVCVVEHG